MSKGEHGYRRYSENIAFEITAAFLLTHLFHNAVMGV